MNMLFKILQLINLREKFFIFIIFALMSLYMALEFASIGILVPLISVLFQNENSFLLVQNKILLEFFNYLNSFRIEILLFLVFLFFFVKNVFIFIFTLIQDIVIFNIRKRLVYDLYLKYLNQSYILTAQLNSAEILRNIDIARNFSTVLISVVTLILEFLVLIALSLFLILYNFNIAITVIVCFAAIIIVSFYITKKKIFKWGLDNQSLDKLLKKSVTENIANIKEIKLYRRESFFLFLLTKLNSSLSLIDLKIDVTQQLPRLLIEITAVTFLCLIIFLNLDISSKAEIISILVAYSAVILRLMPASTRVSAALQRLKFYSPQIIILSKELKFKSSNLFLKNEKKYDSMLNIKSLRIIKIDFSYKNSDNLIKNLDLSLKKGTINCIVGSNGSGKSTLINIILGLLEPDKGKILINNSEKLYKHFKYRYNKIGYVSQNIYLLDDSIKNNIIFGDKNLDLSRLNMSINISGLDKIILSLPNKLETLVGERGIKLSGGQVQKIAIARCFYLNPDFLVLDEFNNNLDQGSEVKILNYLEKIKQNKIIIIISHKKEVIKFCDNIYKFKNKRLIKL